MQECMYVCIQFQSKYLDKVYLNSPLHKLYKNCSGWTTSCEEDEDEEVDGAKGGEVESRPQNPTDDVIRLLSESQEVKVQPSPAAAALPIASVLPDPPDDPVDRFADVTNERLKRAEYLVTEWLTKWWSELEEDMVRYVQYRVCVFFTNQCFRLVL